MTESTSCLALLENRTERLPTSYSYKLAPGTAGQYGLDVAFPDQMDINEQAMSVWLHFADGNRRDGVGDLLEVGGIRTDRHRSNPIVLFDHGKQVTLPIALAEDRVTKAYTVVLDPVAQTGKANAFFYQGTGIAGTNKDDEYQHALLCQQLFGLILRLVQLHKMDQPLERVFQLLFLHFLS